MFQFHDGMLLGSVALLRWSASVVFHQLQGCQETDTVHLVTTVVDASERKKAEGLVAGMAFHLESESGRWEAL